MVNATDGTIAMETSALSDRRTRHDRKDYMKDAIKATINCVIDVEEVDKTRSLMFLIEKK